MFGSLGIGICDLPFDFAQGGESFDFAQDREPVEPYEIWCLELGILAVCGTSLWVLTSRFIHVTAPAAKQQPIRQYLNSTRWVK
jgi:hypothetical protein